MLHFVLEILQAGCLIPRSSSCIIAQTFYLPNVRWILQSIWVIFNYYPPLRMCRSGYSSRVCVSVCLSRSSAQMRNSPLAIIKTSSKVGWGNFGSGVNSAKKLPSSSLVCKYSYLCFTSPPTLDSSQLFTVGAVQL